MDSNAPGGSYRGPYAVLSTIEVKAILEALPNSQNPILDAAISKLQAAASADPSLRTPQA